MVDIAKGRPLRHFSHLSRAHLAVFILVFASIGSFALLSGMAATPKTIWVSASGNDATCAVGNQNLPCLTIDKAYHLVPDGGIVYLYAGTYPYQRLTFDSTKTGAGGHVTIQPAPGVAQSAVHILTVDFGQGQLNIASPQHVTLSNVTLDSVGASVETWGTSNDIELDNLVGHALQLLGGTDLRVNGGDWGKCEVTSDGTTNCTSRMIGTNVVIDGAAIHDVVHNGSLDPQDLNHTEGIFIRGCNDCTITHSKFWHNTTFDIFLQNCCSLPPLQNIKILNNWLAAAGSGSTGDTWTLNTALEASSSMPGLVIAHNSFAEDAGPVMALRSGDPGWVGTNSMIVDNLYMRGGGDCAAGITYRGNIYIPFSQYTGQQICDPSEKKVTGFKYVNYTQDSSFDYHLSSASPAIGAASPLDSALAGTDIDRYAWPSKAPDSGSDQYGASAPSSVPSSPGSPGTGSGSSASGAGQQGTPASSGGSNNDSAGAGGTTSGANPSEGAGRPGSTAGSSSAAVTQSRASAANSAAKKANKPASIILSVLSAASAITAIYFIRKRLLR